MVVDGMNRIYSLHRGMSIHASAPRYQEKNGEIPEPKVEFKNR